MTPAGPIGYSGQADRTRRPKNNFFFFTFQDTYPPWVRETVGKTSTATALTELSSEPPTAITKVSEVPV